MVGSVQDIYLYDVPVYIAFIDMFSRSKKKPYICVGFTYVRTGNVRSNQFELLSSKTDRFVFLRSREKLIIIGGEINQ